MPYSNDSIFNRTANNSYSMSYEQGSYHENGYYCAYKNYHSNYNFFLIVTL